MPFYVLATAEKQVRWYLYDMPVPFLGKYSLLEQLDLHKVPLHASKASALFAAQELGLKTWRYVRFS